MNSRNPEYWELLFCGKDSADIHGVTLRESIRKFASKMNISGEVRNIKTDGTVKVLCKATAEQAQELFDKIIAIKNPLIQGKISGKYPTPTRVTYSPPGNAPR